MFSFYADTVTKVAAYGPEDLGSNPGMGRDHCSHHHVQASSGAQNVSFAFVYQGLFSHG